MSEEKKESSQAANWHYRAELTDKLIKSLHEVGPVAARPFAEELAELLGEETPNSRVVWCDIWEARGCLDKAVEVGQRDIEECLSKIENRTLTVGNVSSLREAVEDLLDAHYFQAKRYLDMGIPGAAKITMLEAHGLSSQYCVPFDDTLKDLFNELCEEE